MEYSSLSEQIFLHSLTDTGIDLIDTNNGNDTTNFALIEPNYRTAVNPETGIMPETEVFSLSAGITKARIYMWIEGQDIDCWNQIADGNIYVNLEFMGRPVK